MSVIPLPRRKTRRTRPTSSAMSLRHWQRHLDAGETAALLFEELAADLADRPDLLAKLQQLEQAVAAGDDAALQALRALDNERSDTY
jgi:hypothetical protein